MTIFTIPKKLTKGEDLVVLKREEYLKLQKQLAEIKDAMEAIKEGEAAYYKGRARKTKTLSDLL